jgi:acetoin utilization deacetylase AcuC-like enzyme
MILTRRANDVPTALITHPACLEHDTGPYHPETAERLRAVLAALEAPEFAPLLRELAPMATVEQLSRVHPQSYVEGILSIHPDLGEPVQLDGDTVMSNGSAEAAARAAGGACMAVDAVMEGWARAAFVAVRPPGHHAEPSRPMGFCLFNNVAVAALHARARWGVRRVAVVDFDVHHGNGTQAMFAADPDLFYASSHQSPCYPGTGEVWETGVADNIVNVPLRPRDDGAAVRARFADRLGGVRCPYRRSVGAIAGGNGGLRLADGTACRGGAAPLRGTYRVGAGGRLRSARLGGGGGRACAGVDADLGWGLERSCPGYSW